MSGEPYYYRLQSFISKEQNHPHSSPFDAEEELAAPLLRNTSNSLSTFAIPRSSTDNSVSDIEGYGGDVFGAPKPRGRRRQSCYAVGLLLLAAVVLLTPLLSTLDTKWLRIQLAALFSSTSDGRSCGCGIAEDKFCNVYGSQANLQLSRIFEGTSSRIDRVLKKGLSGTPLVIGVMGGSVSACHGVAFDSSGHVSGCYVNQIASWFNTALPVKDDHTIHNGAIGGMDSSYYAFCGTNHIPSNVDLVILEFDVNDRPTLDFMVYFDQLVRITLQLPSQPAVIILGAWGPAIAADLGNIDPQAVHLPVAEYYDIPYISMKQMIWSQYLRFPHGTFHAFWTPDGFHPNTRGHRVLSDLITSYLSARLCSIRSTTSSSAQTTSSSSSPSNMVRLSNLTHHWNTTDEDIQYGPALYLEDLKNETYRFIVPDPLSVPSIPFNIPHSQVFDPVSHPDSVESVHLDSPKPFCADANDPNSPLDPREREGWEPYVWKNEKHFWVSNIPGARIVVDITVSEGLVAVFYFRSRALSPGIAQCWVDDNVIGAKKLHGHWDLSMNIPTVSYIDRNVTVGDHYVTCEILEETSAPQSADPHHFRLVAIMAT